MSFDSQSDQFTTMARSNATSLASAETVPGSNGSLDEADSSLAYVH